jgi:hypothetical protein
MTFSAPKLLLLLMLTSAVMAQTPPNSQSPSTEAAKIAPGIVIPAELAKSIDSKKAKEGDPVTAKVVVDMLSGGAVIVPRDTKIAGHVTEAKSRGKGESESTLGIIFDRLILKNGQEIPLHAVVQAVGAPIVARAPSMSENNNPRSSPASNPGGYGSHPGMGGTGQPSNPAGAQNTEDQPANIGGTPPLPMNATGVVGISGLTLRTTSATSSTLASEKKNVKLDSGTQLLLRTANP